MICEKCGMAVGKYYLDPGEAKRELDRRWEEYLSAQKRELCEQWAKEEDAERRWQEYLAATITRLRGEDVEEGKKKKKKRRWGVKHKRLGWLGRGDGTDFTASSRKAALQELGEWMYCYGWEVKRYPSGGEDPDGD